MTYEDNYALVHYGVAGQKWGIRRWQNKDGSLTAAGKEHYGSGEKMAKLYSKEARKLDRYAKATDIEANKAKADKYAAQAKKLAKAAAAVGAVAAVERAVTKIGGDKYIEKKSKALEDENNKLINDAQEKIYNYNYNAKKYRESGNDSTAKSWEDAAYIEKSDVLGRVGRNNDSFQRGVEQPVRAIQNFAKTDAKIGAGAAIALGTAAGVRAVQAKVAKAKTTEIGHAKAVQKYQAQISRMEKMFAGTSYSAVLKNRVEEYKKEHPNTQLTDKQIARNLS